MGAFCLHRHPVSVNCLYHAQMILSVGGSFVCFARNARCTVTTDLLMWYFNTQNDFSPGAAIFSHYIHSHRLAAEMWTTMKNNLLGKNFLSCYFYLYRFLKHVSYDFPIINFCNPGVHYETSCIMYLTAVLFTMVCDMTRHVIHTHTGLQRLQKRVHQIISFGDLDKSISS